MNMHSADAATAEEALALQDTIDSNAATQVAMQDTLLTPRFYTTDFEELDAIDVSNKAFAEDALNAVVNNPTLVPGYISVPAMQNDLTLFAQLDEISGLANQMCERIEDTKMLAGSEAYNTALSLYKSFGTAADAGVVGADSIVDQLKTRFATKTATNPASEPPTPIQ